MKNTKLIALLLAAMTMCALMIPSVSAAADIDTGLVAHYTFDDAANAGKEENGANGTASADFEATEGKVGGAVKFDGKAMLTVENSKLGTLKNFTMSAWMKLNDPSTTDASIVIHTKGDWDVSAMNYNITGTEQISPELNGLWGRWNWWTEDNKVGAEWTLITITFDMTNHVVTFYKDGEVLEEKVFAEDQHAFIDNDFPGVNFENFFIGGGPNNGAQFYGSMDDLRIYNRALTADDVAALAAYTGESGSTEDTGSAETTGTTEPDDTTEPDGGNDQPGQAPQTGVITFALAAAAVASGAYIISKRKH